MNRRAGREPGVELPNSATDVGLAIAVVVACPHDAPIRPALPRLALPIILVPLISGLRLRSCISRQGGGKSVAISFNGSYGRVFGPCCERRRT